MCVSFWAVLACRGTYRLTQCMCYASLLGLRGKNGACSLTKMKSWGLLLSYAHASGDDIILFTFMPAAGQWSKCSVHACQNPMRNWKQREWEEKGRVGPEAAGDRKVLRYCHRMEWASSAFVVTTCAASVQHWAVSFVVRNSSYESRCCCKILASLS